MTHRRPIARLLAAAFALALFAFCVPAVAGTTGGLSGTVADAGGTPLAGVRVSVVSPSQTASTTTDAGGHFAFVSLQPDDYSVSLDKQGYEPVALAGVAVFADAQQRLTFQMKRALATIAHVSAQSASGLVRAGTTADLYSINAAQQERTSALGGGGNLNTAYSAIASVPGAYVPANQSGYLQAVHVRGGDSYEVGYEMDGIPVNRAFDNYPSGSLSSLGQGELQVYTGATPANAEAQGLAGFINQVIKTGTFPGYASMDAGVGSTIFYHSLNVEAGGATPDRLFSYYVGVGGYNQQFRYVDQFAGASWYNEFGQLIGSCPSTPNPALPSCYTNGVPNVGLNGSPGWLLGPIGFGTGAQTGLADRTIVANLHFGIPHKDGVLRDDVQLLYDNNQITTTWSSSVNDEGLVNYNATVLPPNNCAKQCTNAFPPYWLDSYQYTGQLGGFLPADYSKLVVPYFYPSSPAHAFQGPIGDDYNQRDVGYNAQSIVKLQYQKNFSSNAFMRLYGYSYYSNWLENGPMMSLQPYAYYDSGDYEINNHTRGISLSFTDQISPQHLLSAEGSYTTASGARIYNEQMFNYANNFAVLVNPHALDSGTCYIANPSGKGAATPTTCSDFGASGVSYGGACYGLSTCQATFATLAGIYSQQHSYYNYYYPSGPPPASDFTCGGVRCQYFVAESGAYGLNNTVTPAFSGYSITDDWRPGDRWNVNLGVRIDNYSFTGSNTDTGAARNFWFAAFNQDTCFDTQTLSLVDRTALPQVYGGSWTTNSQKPCSAFGKQYTNANLTNSPTAWDYNIVQPRIGATYTVNPNTVLRATYGKYNEQPSSAYEQYNALQQNLPDTLSQFYALGFTSPGHAVAPSISYNTDFSLEQNIRGTDMSYKLSPFLRQTQNQIENFYINYATGLTSGLNAGNQTSTGFEFQFDKGDFSRNGFAAQLSFAYTYATVRYNGLPNGTTVISPINAGISQYNAYTKGCAKGGADYGKLQYGSPICGSTTSHAAAGPCYTTGGAAVQTCVRGDIANPYWDSPTFGLFDPNAAYLPYSTIPGPVGSGVNAYNYPYVATLLLNYKHDKLAITPSIQFQAGNRYGAPLTTPGIDPASGCWWSTASLKGDPRYPYGAPGGSPYNVNPGAALSGSHPCTASLSIPDPYTGNFDGIGAFREPAQITANMRVAYDLSPRVSVALTLTNLVETCFSGQNTKFTYIWNSGVCTYGNLIGGPTTPPVGNAYNNGDNVQTFLKYPYAPSFSVYNDLTNSLNQPFNAYINVKVKL